MDWITIYTAFGVFIMFTTMYENWWRIKRDCPPTRALSISTLICGALFCGIIWPIVVVVKLIVFFYITVVSDYYKIE